MTNKETLLVFGLTALAVILTCVATAVLSGRINVEKARTDKISVTAADVEVDLATTRDGLISVSNTIDKLIDGLNTLNGVVSSMGDNLHDVRLRMTGLSADDPAWPSSNIRRAFDMFQEVILKLGDRVRELEGGQHSMARGQADIDRLRQSTRRLDDANRRLDEANRRLGDALGRVQKAFPGIVEEASKDQTPDKPKDSTAGDSK